ncbi:MAG: DUF2384 domain-containing protein [Bryobacterales bacterium]|nr:DUF2384 domain-containing protein [Bryobacterales bacterium]
MVEPTLIGEILGGAPVLGQPVASQQDLMAAVERGLPKMALFCLARRVFPDTKQQAALIRQMAPEALCGRMMDRLSRAESERICSLARVVVMAGMVWQDPGQARRFLTTAHPETEGETPLQNALSESGAVMAEAVMARIVYGLPV